MPEQEEKQGKDGGESKDEPKVEPPPHHEESLSETEHSVKIGRKTIPYKASAGRIVLSEEEGKKEASFFFVAYMRSDVKDVSTRPIVFSFNGGPGSASVWLHLGAFGPRRVLMEPDGMPLPPPSKLVDNEYSILDVADLVFIDPVSTGYSRAIPEDKAKDFHGFKKDIESVGEFIRIFLTRNGRWASPKYIAGESYGTTRSAGLAGHLWRRHAIAFNGLLLVSSILNFQTAGFDSSTWTFRRGNDLPYVVFLPTYAATAWYHGRLPKDLQKKGLRTVLDEVEEFADGEYAAALLAGSAVPPKRYDAIASKVARYTGLPVDYVKRCDLRIEILWFCKELLRDRGRVVGRIDSRFTGIERFDGGHMMENDPSLDAVMPAYSAAFNHYVRHDLGYESDLPYEVLSERVRPWSYSDFENSYVDVSETLREVMSRNPFMKVFVANGYFDLATPHHATEFTFSHLGLDESLRDNVEMAYYEAGHMMYVHEKELAKLGTDARRFIESSS